jgi:5,5'-dehydrodivanillate O-demethylase
MLKHEQNQRLSKVGQGTPGGEMLRRYWWPVAAASELTDAQPKKRVRILGEDLVLFRNLKGNLGLVEEQCPHRSASLYYGFVEEDGLRCAYHGWKYDCSGACIEMPFEPRDTPLKNEIRAKAYPLKELSGLIFAYLGPNPAPLLPNYDPLVRRDATRKIFIQPLLACNWLQVMENSCDPSHTHYLHGYNMHRLGSNEGDFHHRPIKAMDFMVVKEPSWGGIVKKRIYEGEELENTEGHPVIFPNILLLPPLTPSEDGTEIDQPEIPAVHTKPIKGADDDYHLETFASQDGMAWETQGAITDRQRENLGTADRGIVLFRRLLGEQIDTVERGEDPVGVIRDPALNQSIRIELSKQQENFWAQHQKADA